MKFKFKFKKKSVNIEKKIKNKIIPIFDRYSRNAITNFNLFEDIDKDTFKKVFKDKNKEPYYIAMTKQDKICIVRGRPNFDFYGKFSKNRWFVNDFRTYDDEELEKIIPIDKITDWKSTEFGNRPKNKTLIIIDKYGWYRLAEYDNDTWITEDGYFSLPERFCYIADLGYYKALGF